MRNSKSSQQDKKGDVQAPQRRIASTEEIKSAMAGLTNKELARLERFAEVKILGLKAVGKCAGQEAYDLVAKAFEKVLDGSRKWYLESASFFDFIRGAIQSIASNERKAVGELSLYPDSEISDPDFGSILDNEPSLGISAEHRLIASQYCGEILSEIETAISDDEDMQMLLELRKDGKNSKSDWVELGLPPEDFDKTRQRLDYRLKMIEKSIKRKEDEK